MTQFKDLAIGDTFDWVNPNAPTWNSFYHPCRKTGPRTYVSLKGMNYRVGSVKAEVFHVNSFVSPKEG